MKARAVVVTCLFLIVHFASVAQEEMFREAFQEFSTSRFWEYEEITVEWKMQGMIQADLNEGINHLFEKNPRQAEASFNSVLEKDSSVWQAYYYRAASRKLLEKLREAEKDLMRALRLHGDFYEGYVELAKVLHMGHQTEESERAINKAIKINRSKGTAYYLKGDINLSQNQARAAVTNYNDCLAADSLFHDARIKLALLAPIDKDDYSAPLKHLNKVLQYDSLQKTALLFRSIFVYEKNKAQALRDLTKLISVSPEHLMAYYFRGLCSAELRDFDRAFADFHKVIKATATDDNNFVGQQTWLDKKIDLQNAGAYTVTRVYGLPEEDALKIKMAYCYILIGEFDKSIAAIENLSDPWDEPLAAYLKAVAYEHKGQHLQALKYYNRSLELDNDISDAHKKRGIYKQELRQWESSINDFAEVLRLDPGIFFTYRLRGVSYYHTNRFQQALADFNSYLKHDSTSKDVIGFRGMTYQKLGIPLKAYVDFAVSDNVQAIDLKKAMQLINEVLVDEDTVEALYCLDKITRAVPHFTELYAQKFKLWLRQGNWKPVEEEITNALRHSRVDAPKAVHSYLLTIQALMFKRHRHEEDALRTFAEAIKFDRKNSLAYLERGKLWMALGKTSKAQSDFEEASVLGDEQAQELLAAMLEKKQ